MTSPGTIGPAVQPLLLAQMLRPVTGSVTRTLSALIASGTWMPGAGAVGEELHAATTKEARATTARVR